MIKRILLLLALVFCFAFSAVSDSKDPMQVERFKTIDSNKNGFVSQYETRGKHLIFYYYQKADSNADGHIDLGEFSRFEKKHPHTAKSNTWQ